jgi:thiazole synthase
VERGFVVLPYINADPVLAKRLEEVGVHAVMPLGAPIGTNRGIETRAMLEIIIANSLGPVGVDAGLGAPSHAAEAIEMGADAVLVNTAIAAAGDPGLMAEAFADAVAAAEKALEAVPPPKRASANPTSPMEIF